MHIGFQTLAIALGASSLVAAAPAEASAVELMQNLNRQAINALESTFAQPTERSTAKKCTLANAAVRRDW